MNIILDLLAAVITLSSTALQQSFSDNLYGPLLACSANHPLVRINALLDFRALKDACAAFHHSAGAGSSPTHPTNKLVRTLIVKHFYSLSLRECETELHANLLVRWFCGYGLFEQLPDHSTLARFESWVRATQPRLYLDELIRQIDERFPAERQAVQVGDTFGMLANAARADLIPLLRQASLQLLRSGVEEAPPGLERALQGFDWVQLFGPYPERLAFFLDKAGRQQRQQETVLGALELRRRLAGCLDSQPSTAYPATRTWLERLEKIVADEVRVVIQEGGPAEVQRLAPKQRGDFRIGSASDPEATYRVHGDDGEHTIFGYNVQVAATLNGLVREIQAYTGASPDQVGVDALVAAQLEHHGACPPKLIYDLAGGNGKTRAEVAQASQGQTLLAARLPDYAKNKPRFNPYDFRLSADGLALTCPNGKVSTTAYKSLSGDGRDFRFFACQCWQDEPPARMKGADLALRCPLWEQCRDQRQGPKAIRQVFISDYRAEVIAAREYNQTDQFQKEMRQRALIERVVMVLTHYCDARRCRGRGLAYADFQAKMSAVTYDLKWLLRRT